MRSAPCSTRSRNSSTALDRAKRMAHRTRDLELFVCRYRVTASRAPRGRHGRGDAHRALRVVVRFTVLDVEPARRQDFLLDDRVLAMNLGDVLVERLVI